MDYESCCGHRKARSRDADDSPQEAGISCVVPGLPMESGTRPHRTGRHLDPEPSLTSNQSIDPCRPFIAARIDNYAWGYHQVNVLQPELPGEGGGLIRTVLSSYVCLLPRRCPCSAHSHQGRGFAWWLAPSYPPFAHHRAMIAASPYKKGIFLDKATNRWRAARLDRSRPGLVIMPKEAKHFALPFYDPCTLNSRCF